MEKEELMERYDALIDSVSQSGNVEYMRMLGSSMRNMFCTLADMDMDGAADIYGRLEGEMMYNNYLSEDEADNIASGFVNQDGSHGAHWSKSDVKAYIERVGGLMESSPYYNKCAMYVTFNMVYSYFHNALNKAVLGDSGKYMSAVYEMAVSFLKDVDNKRWIRHHYRID